MKTKRLTAMLLAAAMTLGTFSSVALATDTENTTGSDTSAETSSLLSGLDERSLEVVVADAEAQYAASKSGGVAAISEDDGTADLTAEERSSVKESIYNDILFSDSSVVDVSGYDMDADTLSTLTDEVLAEEGMTELVDYEYEEDEVSGNATIAVYSVDNELAAAANEASEIEVIAEDGTSSALTEEQLQTVMYLYGQYLEDYNANVAYLGRQTPFFTAQESVSEDGLGQLGSMLILAGATVDQVRSGEYTYDELVGTIQIFLYGDTFGVEYYGSDMIAAKDEALQAVEESGAETEEQKLLVLNDWMANNCSFDMEYIMNQSSDEAVLVASDPQQSEHYDEMYQFFYSQYYDTMVETYGETYGAAYADAAAAQFVSLVEGMWNGNLIGALALGKGVCMAYTSAYTYLVQWMNPEVYAADGKTLTTDADSWKTVEELNCESETTTETVETEVQATDDDGNALYYVLDEDGNKVASTEDDGYDYQVTTEETAEKVMETTTENVSTTTYTVSTDADYLVDFVMINYDADVTMYGEEWENFTSQHFWNAVKVNGQWYYIDVCYIDIFTECMIRDRVETNGDMNHVYFLMSDDAARNMYDGYYTDIVTLYEGVATDTSYQNNSWIYFAASNVYGDGNGKFYYAYDSTDLIDALDNPTDYMDATYEYKIVYHDASSGDTNTDYTTLVDLTGGTVYNPTTGQLEDNELIQELYALHEDYVEKYPSLTLSMALYDDMIYFNLANCVLSYDLDTGEVTKVKEYNEVGAVRDQTVAFAGVAFDVVYDLSEADLTVMDPPVAGLVIYDGNLYVDLATNYAYISGKDAHNYTDSSSYGWEFQESNYNSEYSTYMAWQGWEDEENDNDEFMWSANFTDTIAMSTLTSSDHNYETVSVAATCDHDAFTESRCADCGLIEADTRVEEEGTACEHHYVKFDETYYTKDDDTDEWNTGTCYVCVICGDAVEEDDDGWDEAVANAEEGHDYVASEEGITWADDYSTATVTELTCDVCGSLVSNILTINDDGENEETTVPSWDCLQDDDTITVALEEALTCDVTSEIVSGSCDEGVTVVYTAVGPEGSDYEGVVLGQTTVTTEAGEHAYTTSFNWAEDYSTCTVDLVCSVCGDEQSVECEVTSETTAATCTEAGQTVYTATATVGETEYTDTKTVEIDALGHSYGEPTFTWAEDNTCTATFTCATCGDVQTVDCDVTYETADATCTTGGTVTYTATATFEDETYTDTKTTTVEALGHSYGEPTFTWSEDYSTCTATFACARCDDEQTVSCNVTSATTDATCTEAGATVYTATATFNEQTYTDTKTVEIPALGHTYTAAPTFNWADDYSTCEAVFTCATCGETETVTCDVTYETADATCTTGGTVTYTATAAIDGTSYTDTKVAEVEALGHDYGEPTFTWADDDTCTATFTCTRCDDTQTVACDVVENEDGSLTATCTFGDETYTNTKSTTPVDEIFTDVTADDWYYEAVQFVYDHDLMVGTSDTTFSPTMTTTRAMVVQILYNMEGQPEVSGEMPFSDVSESDWYYNAVLWAYQNNVTAGDGNGNFNPTTKVTREQFAQFLYNYEGKPEVSGTIDFTDASSVSSWATDAILWATQNGIMNGKDNNGVITLDPQGQATRAEVAAMLKNYCENV